MKHSLSAYRRVRVGDRTAYIKPGVLGQLGDVGAMIFDCDGVLIDARKSYDKSIGRTASLILSQLIGFSFPQRIVSQSIIYTLRRGGGFNNDWNSTYVILLYIFSRLPKPFLDRFDQARRELFDGKGERPDWPGQLDQLSHQVRGMVQREQIHNAIERIRGGLLRFVDQADSSGVASLEKRLFDEQQPMWKRRALRSLKNILGYPQQATRSLLVNIFDEIYYGPALFQKLHGHRPRFYLGDGAIENETLILKPHTLERLKHRFSSSNLGIASGRGTIAARHTLGSQLNAFNPKARVFLEDHDPDAADDDHIPQAERAKPAPYALLKAASAMKRFKRALYLGDSAEDLIMSQRANQRDPRYLFAGVIDHGYDPGQQRRMFATGAADVIVPSVNQVPDLLSSLSQE